MTNGRRITSNDLLIRQPLDADWHAAEIFPGLITSPEQLTSTPLQWIATRVPATAASTLRAAGVWSLDEPARNFDAHDWWYRCSFAKPATLHEQFVLHFAGLATVADVWLNGTSLLHSENMFRSHACDVTSLLQPSNELLIHFTALDTLLKQKKPRPRWKAPMIANQQLRWWRTTVLGRTPGWSPPAAPVGPWREVWLEGRNHLAVTNTSLHTTLTGTTGTLTLAATIKPLQATRINHVVLTARHQTHTRQCVMHGASQADNTFSCMLEINNVAPWWPHTHGEPALYDLAVEVTWQDVAGNAHTQSISLGKSGFRHVALDSSQHRFALSVNDVEVFCRGACWTPPDVVALNSSREQLLASLTLLRDAGMNMIRVGGTMVYESEDFLALCDELGILLWQDCMFANMDFPETAEFISEVTAELGEQLQRLQGHPCLALICGNSEAEQQAAMFGASRECWSPVLFHSIIPALVKQHLHDTPYWPSSAHGGEFPHQNNSGSTSYYGVGAYLRPMSDARHSEVKFASECLAFANVPEDASIEQMPTGLGLKVHHARWKERTPRDLGAGWDFEDVRDFYLQVLFGVNALQLRYADHDRYLAWSRVVSGEVMAATFNEWRRNASQCRGALIWFWQDLWHGASWGVLDAAQQPKAAYYYLKRSLQPINVALTDEGTNGLAIHLQNDTASTVNATLKFELYRLGKHRVAAANQEIVLAARHNHTLAALGLFEHFADHNHAYRFGPPMGDVAVATLCSANGERLSQTCLLPLGLSPTQWPDPMLTAALTMQDDHTALLTLSATGFAQAVHIDCPGWRAEDQYFALLPGEPAMVRLRRHGSGNGAPRGAVRALNSLTTTNISLSS
jgi:beta-mannosidase